MLFDYIDHCNKTFSQPYPNDGRLYCNATFDAVLCWNYTLAGTRAYGKCPDHHPASQVFGSAGFSFKDCNADGTWYTYPGTEIEWTNYTTCLNTEAMEKTQHVIYVYLSGFGVSVALLVLSVILFSCLRQLQCTRVTLHKNLFMSYILTGISWILYYSLASLNQKVVVENPIWCRALHVVTQYVTICNFAWMFAEGFYLHSVIVSTFSNEKKLLVTCVVIGWVFPLIPTVCYAVIRGLKPEDEQKKCWSDTTTLNWILLAPIIGLLFINFCFLINILRIIISKIRAVQSNESNQIRKTVRACLILVPLLGLQCIIVPFRPKQNTFVYDVIIAILISYQGAFVALLFCFFNKEVIQTTKKKIIQMKSQNGQRHLSLLTVGTSLGSSRRTSIFGKRSSLSKQSSVHERKQSDPVVITDSNPQYPQCNGSAPDATENRNGRSQSVDSERGRYALLPISEV